MSIFIKKNICFENLQSAVNFINTNYNSIDKWWNKSETQTAINKFCKCYCKRPENLDKELQKLKFIN
jgi:putative transferase (TIGR04331 family)